MQNTSFFKRAIYRKRFAMSIGGTGVRKGGGGLKRDVGTHVLKEPNEKRERKNENEGEEDSRGSFN